MLFSIIGVLLGFILGFMLASGINRREATPVTGGRTQNLPANHPPTGDAQGGTPGAMQAEVAAALDKAKKEPTNFAAQFKAAQLYYQIGQFDDAIAYLLKANQLNPDDIDTVVALGDVNMEARHFEVAEKWFSAAVLKDPKNARIQAGYCNVLLEEGKAKEAAEAIAKLAEIQPGNQDLVTLRERLAKLKP